MSEHTRERLISKLQATSLLRGLDRRILDQLTQRATQTTFATGAVLFLEGDPAPGLYYLDAGWVKIVKMSPDGREQILAIWSAGELFGGVVSIVGNRPAPATAIALDTCTAWVLPHHTMQPLLVAHPELMMQMLTFMADRMGDLIELVVELSLHTVTSRLARLLLEQAEDGVIQRHRWATQSEMAARLGTVPDVLNRALRELVEARLIELSRTHIRILDQPALAAKSIPVP